MPPAITVPIILAAGTARRMGSNKLIADLGGKPVLVHVIDAVEAAGLGPPLIVLGHAAEAVRAVVGARCANFVDAPGYRGGMAHSIAAGITALPPEAVATIICLGDMPFTDPRILRRLAAGAAADAILVPVHAGRRGNPVLWGSAYFQQLASLRGDVGARQLLDMFADRVSMIDWSDDSIHVDIDTPDMLARLGGRLIPR